MLEILLLRALTGAIGKVVEAKGKPSGWYKFLAVMLWFGGELLGAVIGFATDMGAGAYLLALMGAAAGAGIAYQIAKSAAPAVEALPSAAVFD